jgi:DNA-binding IclR family transcriptional regulator
MDGASEEAGGVAAVERALSILEAFSEADSSLSLAELAARTSLYKSTILRLIQSLERFAFIERGADSRYRIGPGAWRVGALFMRELRLEERLMPVLAALAERTTESASFYVPTAGPARVCLLRVDSPHTVRDIVRIGDRLPLDAGAGGRVIRAFLFPGNKEDDAIRASGLHATWGDRDKEIAGVAAPVFGADNRLVGALTLSAPTARRDRAWVASMRPVVLSLAVRASRALGCKDPDPLTGSSKGPS